MAFSFAPHPARAAEPDWGRVGKSQVVLFYPGVTSWEFLTSEDHRLGGKEILKGKKDCRHCHLSKEGDLDLKAEEIASGTVKMKRSHNPFEPEPSAGRKGVVSATMQAAYDADYLYLKVEWDSRGAAWARKKGPESVPDRVSVQLNKAEPSFRKYGCFVTCHSDLNTMPSAPPKKEVGSHPYYRGLERNDVRLYAYYAKTSWNGRLNEKELEKKLKEGGRIDLRAVEFEDGKAAAKDGWVFDDRVWDDDGDDASGSWSNGRYSAVFRIKLQSKDPFDAFVSDGDIVTIGLAIHDDGVAKRKHYVSFPLTIGLGAGGADVKAGKAGN